MWKPLYCPRRVFQKLSVSPHLLGPKGSRPPTHLRKTGMEAIVGLHPTRQPIWFGLRHRARSELGAHARPSAWAREGGSSAQDRPVPSQGHPPSRPTRRASNRQSIQSHCVSSKRFCWQRQGALRSRTGPGVQPRRPGARALGEWRAPGALPAENPREGCGGWRLLLTAAGRECQGVSARPRKRASRRTPQKREKTGSSEAVSPPPPLQRTCFRLSLRPRPSSPSTRPSPPSTRPSPTQYPPLPPVRALASPPLTPPPS